LENAAVTRAEMGLPAADPLALTEADPPNLPVANGDGRGSDGRFVRGNQFAMGHRTEIGRRTSEFRTLLLEAVNREDFLAIVDGLMTEARARKPWAVKLALSYLAGEPEAMTEDRLQALEMILRIGGE
jgi:hypothetical protein